MTTLRALLLAGRTLGQARLRRRDLLRGGAATGLTVALPACGAENGPEGPSPDTSTSSALTPSSSAVPSTTESPTITAAATGSSAAPTTQATTTAQTSTQANSSTTQSEASSTSSSTSETSSEVTSSDSAASETSASSTAESTSADTSSSATNGELTVPPWDDVPVCDASRTDGAGQGPFYIHNGEKDDDVDLFRQDIRGRYNEDAEEGTEMHLHLRVLQSGGANCTQNPVSDVEVYIWHTDGQGYYSGFGNPGDQKPDDPYAGVPGQNDLDNSERFCRGAAITDSNGVVSFRSIFPGWYNGRDVHIHFVALQKGSTSRGRMMYSGGDHLFTTQLYFDQDLTDSVHTASEPYLRRSKLTKYADAIVPNEPGNSGIHFKASFDGSLVVAQVQILLDANS